jgi:hypothetical protein
MAKTKTLQPSEIVNGQSVGVKTAAADLKALIARRHPVYEELSEHWDFLADTYEGGRGWFKKHIFRYYKEGEEEFDERVSRAYRFNHTREVVDVLTKYVFKQDANRSDDAPPSLQKFWKRATRSGLSIKEFMRQVSTQTSISGRVGVVVDRPAIEANVSKAEAGLVLPYCYSIAPSELLDYSFDEDKQLNWVLLREHFRDDANPLTSSGKVTPRFRLWTRTDWRLFALSSDKKTVKQIDAGEHNLGEVPIVLADHLVNDELYESHALIDDIAYLDRAVANYLSNLDAIIQDQTFSQLAMPAQNVAPGDLGYEEILRAGTKRIFTYDGQSGTAPFYLSPDPKQAELIVTVINKIINEIYHSVGLAGERTKQDNAVGIDNSSGVAKAFDFERVNALLASKGDSLELTENRIARLVCLWMEEPLPQADLVNYPESYDVRDVYDEFDIAAKLLLVQAPDAVRRQQMTTLVDKIFPMLKEDLKKAMLDELKEWPLDPIEQAAKLAEATAPAQPTAKPGEKPPVKTPTRQGQVTKKTK